MLKQLPVDVSTFATLISENYVYVDKTEHIYNLVTQGRYYFISRPRRFGKSLLMSTLSELFKGNRALFKNLWIDRSDYQWAEHPVVYLDFSRIDIETPGAFKKDLIYQLSQIADSYAITINYQAESIQSVIDTLVKQLSKKNKVVILIDEYDYPIINNLNNIAVAEANREIIKGFFSTIKSLDAHLRAIFITGVTRFAKTSVFSGMNNVDDITLDPIAASLLGYTQQELEDNFSPYLEILAQQEDVIYEELLAQVKDWYNGYRFSSSPETVYNPFSIGYLCKKRVFANYWFQSGTPTFLVELMKKNPEKPVIGSEPIIIGSESLGNFNINSINIPTLLFQAGYLTITKYNARIQQYTLDFTNKETQQSFALVGLALNESAQKKPLELSWVAQKL